MGGRRRQGLILGPHYAAAAGMPWGCSHMGVQTLRTSAGASVGAEWGAAQPCRLIIICSGPISFRNPTIGHGVHKGLDPSRSPQAMMPRDIFLGDPT